MVSSTPGSSPVISLDQQIRNAEQRLMRRRESSVLHAAALKRGLLGLLVSPVTLLVTAGIGWFIAGRSSKPPRRARRSRLRAASRGKEPSVFATINNLLTLAGSIMALRSGIDAAREPAGSTPGDLREG